jgi:hypothetical protein
LSALPKPPFAGLELNCCMIILTLFAPVQRGI